MPGPRAMATNLKATNPTAAAKIPTMIALVKSRDLMTEIGGTGIATIAATIDTTICFPAHVATGETSEIGTAKTTATVVETDGEVMDGP